MQAPVGLDHIGIAVPSIEQARKFYDLLGLAPPKFEVVEREQVRICMYTLAQGVRIELIEPTSDTSSVAKFLQRKGPGLHHICFKVRDVKVDLKRLKQQGLQLIHEVPFCGAQGCQVAFVHPKSASGVLVELSQGAD